MPLTHSKSPKAFKHNLKAELGAGKPKDQALAIAYSVQRRGKKMSKGGVVSNKKLHPGKGTNPLKMVHAIMNKRAKKD